MTSKKAHLLTVNEKVEIIQLHDQEKLPVKELVKRFKCGKTQIYDALKNKDHIMKDWVAGNGAKKRKGRVTGNEEINEAVWEWFVAARAKNLPISGPILQSEALAVAKRLENTTFKASVGWLNSFKERHGIGFNQVCGEAKDIDVGTVESWKQELQNLTSGYDSRDIYNADETGLFFRALPNKTLCLRGEKCVGGKISKERLTVLVCGNLCGDMEKPLVIGKATKPRCFKNLKIESLPVIWRSNKKAWMTAGLMEEWLTAFNSKMKREKRKVLMFLDNATCHPHLQLSNVKLMFLPANTTSCTQPMDQGIICTFKSHYRRLVLQSLVAKMSSCSSVNDLAKEITVLDAVQWIAAALKRIQTDTITKCFLKAGFFCEKFNEGSATDEVSENLNTIQNLCRETDALVAAIDYVRIDDALMTDHTFRSAVELVQSKDDEREREDEDDDEEEEEGLMPEPKISSHSEAISHLQEIIHFAVQQASSDIVHTLYNVKMQFENDLILRPKTQLTLPDLWKKK